MGHAAHVEVVRQVVEAVLVLQDQRKLAHQARVLEVPGERRDGLGDEQRVVGRQRRDEGRREAEVVLGPVAGAAGPAVALEGLVEEDLAPLGDERRLGTGRRRGLAGRQRQEC